MPTTFNLPTNGEICDASDVTQFAGPIQALQSGAAFWAGQSAGTSTAYTASLTPAANDNTPGTIANLTIDETNTGASTLALNGHTALPLRKNGAALVAGDLVAGAGYSFLCDGTYWHVVGGGGSAGSTNASTAFSSGQVPLARGGTGADLSATGGSSQFLKQTSTGGNVSVGGILANDLPANIDCAKLANGNVSNAEFQMLADISTGSTIQTQLDGKAASSHNHAASAITSGQLALARGGTGVDLSATGGAGQVLRQSTSGGSITVSTLTYTDVGAAAASHAHAASDITSGTIATARLGSGTADGTTFLAGDQTYKTVTATDSTKLPLTGGTLSGALNFSSTGTPTMGMARDGLGNLALVSSWALAVNTPGGCNFANPVDIASPAVAVASTTFTTVRTIPTSPCRVSVFVAALGSAELYWDGTTLSVWKSLADTNIVAAASAGSGEVAWRVSSGNLQASNNTGSSKNCYAGLSRR